MLKLILKIGNAIWWVLEPYYVLLKVKEALSQGNRQILIG
jgi:hypothetical protein